MKISKNRTPNTQILGEHVKVDHTNFSFGILSFIGYDYEMYTRKSHT